MTLPDALLKVVIVPLIKDKTGDICSISNYRPIALSTMFSKILEVIVLNRSSEYLGTGDNQFAYKNNHGTDMPITLLKNVTLEYTRRNTPVYACFMDMSKAFDKVCHALLFEMLLKRGVPQYIVHILQIWYGSQKMSVRWAEHLSSDFTVSCGVKQGGIISPYLFNVYMDGLSQELNKIKVGCVVHDKIVNHMIYADDIVLLSPSLAGLQKLVNASVKYISLV